MAAPWENPQKLPLVVAAYKAWLAPQESQKKYQ